MTRLDAWLEGEFVGQFIFDDHGPAAFEYADDAPDTPISLSLPRDRPATRNAAANFLENLLPDHATTRARMATVYSAPSTDTADLLSVAGGDIAGGLVLLPEGASPPLRNFARLNPALDRDIADRINSIKLDPDAWVPRDTPARFSLAGTQGKFALAAVDDDWYWSSASLPSTHIFKPGRPSLRNVEAAEVAALTLASAVGVTAPEARVFTVDDQTAFMVSRFDRVEGNILARRLHAEDLAQATGHGPDDKYGISAKQIVALLGTLPEGESLTRQFLGQLVFNTIIGNADAHAKNYSLLLRPEGAQFAPLYDALPIGLYPQFNQALAMRISGARFPQAVSPMHWQKLARTIGFDQDEMTELVEAIASGVLESNDHAWDTLDADQSAFLRESVRRNASTSAGLVKPDDSVLVAADDGPLHAEG